jgi:glyoxylase-like metal-dependent hydrolase (beta-lactamase superfamily II)
MITIKHFIFNPFQVNTYLLFDEQKEAVLVDPGMIDEAEYEQLNDYLKTESLTVKALFYTHGHFDHICGSHFFKDIPVYGHNADDFLIQEAVNTASAYGLTIQPPRPITYSLNDGDTFTVGDTSFSVFHLPGHSPGSVGLYHKANRFVIAGDVLFKDSIGRTDLPQGSLDVLLRNINEKLLTLDDSTTVFSGHGPETEVGYEKKNNPFINTPFV